MKKTISTLIILTALAGGSGSANANDTAIQSRVDQIKSEFNLDEQQAKRIANILTNAGMSKEEKRNARMEKRIQRRAERMTRRLELNDTQATQLKDILTQQSNQMRALHEQGKADITAILTPEQATKFASMRDHHKGKGRKGWGGKRHGKRGRHGNKCEAH